MSLYDPPGFHTLQTYKTFFTYSKNSYVAGRIGLKPISYKLTVCHFTIKLSTSDKRTYKESNLDNFLRRERLYSLSYKSLRSPYQI